MTTQQFELRRSWTEDEYPGELTVEAILERNRTMPDGYALHIAPEGGEVRVRLYAYVGEAIQGDTDD